MARSKKGVFSGMMNILVIVMLIPAITGALVSEDPTQQALFSIIPILLIVSAMGDFM